MKTKQGAAPVAPPKIARGDGRAPAARQPAPVPARRRAPAGPEATIAAGVFTFILGGTWDVAWHIEVGRDTFWSPPHLLLYAGILLVLGACAAAFVDAWRRRRLPAPGVTIAAVGAGLALASAPIDNLWHRLYGLDVTIWSPPHILLIGGMAVAAYGALAGFTLEANRRLPTRLAALWRSTAEHPTPGSAPAWAGHRRRREGDAAGSPAGRRRGAMESSEAGLYLAGGIMLATALAALGEYAFDVSRYAVVYHPILLCALSALVLTAAARAGGRVGGATLAAAAYTAVGILAELELMLLARVRFQIPLVLLAAPALDLALWKLTPGRGWRGAALGGAAFAAALLLVQTPFTVAANTVVWDADVLGLALAPSVLLSAAAAPLGWALGAAVRPVRPPAPVRPSHRARGAPTGPPRPIARWNGWTGLPGIGVALAVAGLVVVGIAPAVRAPGSLPAASSLAATPGRQVAGVLELSPAVPVAGQPLTMRLTFTDPSVVGPAGALPFESPRADDVASGAMRATEQPGVYQATFTPRRPGRRWVSVIFPGEQGRTVASAGFVVYRAAGAPGQAPQSPRPVSIRPEPGPDEDLPAWLEPAAYLLLALVLAGAAAAIAATLRRARRSFEGLAAAGA